MFVIMNVMMSVRQHAATSVSYFLQGLNTSVWYIFFSALPRTLFLFYYYIYFSSEIKNWLNLA